MQPRDPHAEASREREQFIDLRHRYAELGVGAGRAHVLVMPAADARIDAHEYLASSKHFRPVADRMQIVQGHAHAVLETEFVFAARREVRREQHSLGSDIGNRGEYLLELSLRDAFDHQACRIEAPQNIGVPIGLHRIGPAVDRATRLKAATALSRLPPS
jgi:hypothetical protein